MGTEKRWWCFKADWNQLTSVSHTRMWHGRRKGLDQGGRAMPWKLGTPPIHCGTVLVCISVAMQNTALSSTTHKHLSAMQATCNPRERKNPKWANIILYHTGWIREVGMQLIIRIKSGCKKIISISGTSELGNRDPCHYSCSDVRLQFI